jgi:hypothetical protein
MSANPMNLIDKMNASPRCGATSKRSGEKCRAPAVTGWRVCRFHGARGGAPKGPYHGHYRHGYYSQAAKVDRLALRVMLKAFAPNGL